MSNNTNFADYIANALADGIYGDTPEGDFIEDASNDSEQNVMRSIHSWDELKFYLEDKNACDGAIEAAGYVWNDYMNTK